MIYKTTKEKYICKHVTDFSESTRKYIQIGNLKLTRLIELLSKAPNTLYNKKHELSMQKKKKHLT